MTITKQSEDLIDGEIVEALVKMDILELLEKPKQFIIDFLALHALGTNNIGKFMLDEFEMELVGMMKQDLLFEVRGTARKLEQSKKKKPSLKKSKSV